MKRTHNFSMGEKIKLAPNRKFSKGTAFSQDTILEIVGIGTYDDISCVVLKGTCDGIEDIGRIVPVYASAFIRVTEGNTYSIWN